MNIFLLHLEDYFQGIFQLKFFLQSTPKLDTKEGSKDEAPVQFFRCFQDHCLFPYCYVNAPCNFCSCSCRFTASCASFCIVSSFSSVTDFMGIIFGLQRTGIGVCSVKSSPCFGRTSLKTSVSPVAAILNVDRRLTRWPHCAEISFNDCKTVNQSSFLAFILFQKRFVPVVRGEFWR